MDHPDRLNPPQTVCGRTIESDPAYFPCAKFRGRLLYFCTEACLEAFHKDPERFLEVHRPATDREDIPSASKTRK